MPFINSFVHDAVVTPPTYVPLIGGMDVTLSMSASLSAVAGTINRSASGFQQVTSSFGDAKSKTLAFSVMPADTIYSGRIVVFQICASFDNSGKGTISSISYGGVALSRAIATASTGDKGSAEIWYGVFATQPVNDNLVVVASESMYQVIAGREIIIGATQIIPDRVSINKTASSISSSISMTHVANSLAIVNAVCWKGGMSSLDHFNWEGDSPNAVKTWFTLNTDSHNFATVGGYNLQSTADTGRVYRAVAFGVSNPTVELCGAIWK